jgi:hypothetical protein
LKSLVGTQAPLQQEALNLARGATEEFTADTAKKYMSPYLRASLDAQKAEAQRQYERTKVPEFEAQAVRAGGMSGLGTRAAVEAAERATGQQRLLADIEAKGQQKAFEAAQQQFENQQARERQAAAQISTAAPQIFKSGVAEQGLLQTIGEDKRRLGQSALDEAYARYIEQQQFPETQLARYQSAIYGNPLLKQRSGTVTGTQTGGGPGLGKTLLGLGTTALGFGTGGGNTLGGTLFGKMFGKAGGGRVTEGLTATMQARPYVNYMRRNMGGQVVPPVVYRQTGSVIPNLPQDTYKDIELGKIPKPKSGTRQNLRPTYAWGEQAQLDEAESYQGGLSDLQRKKAIRAAQLNPPRPELEKDKQSTLKEITELKKKEEESRTLGIKPKTGKRESIELYGSESGDDTGGGIGERNIALQNLAIGRTPIPTETTTTTKKESTIGGLTQKDVAKGARENIEGKAKALGEQAVQSGVLSKAVVDKARKRNKTLFDKIEKRIGDNPYKLQKFWFTVGANIMKRGNAFANLADGLRIAVNELDVDRKEKDKLLNELDTNRVDTENELDKTKLASDLKVLGITTKQKKLLAGKTAAEQKAIIDLIKAGATFKTAEAAVIRAEAAKIKAGIPGQFDLNEVPKFVTSQLEGIANLPDFVKGKPSHDGARAFKNTLSVIVRSAGDNSALAQQRFNAAIERWRAMPTEERKSFKG